MEPKLAKPHAEVHGSWTSGVLSGIRLCIQVGVASMADFHHITTPPPRVVAEAFTP